MSAAANRAASSPWPGLAPWQQGLGASSSAGASEQTPAEALRSTPSAASQQSWIQSCTTSGSANGCAADAQASSAQASKDGSRKPALPYARTLHYVGCGCPAEWSKGSRVADLVDLLVARCHAMYAAKLLTPNRPLRVSLMRAVLEFSLGPVCEIQ